MMIGIYPGEEHVAEAQNLYGRLQDGLAGLGDAPAVGGLALDVGGREGRYVSVIEALGADEVVVIDPSKAAIERGLGWGAIGRSFTGELEDWVTSPSFTEADSAFVFNMLPRLAINAAFLGALCTAVRPGGLVVTSTMEPGTCLSLNSHLRGSFAGRVEWLGAAKPDSRQLAAHVGYNCYINFWKRTDHRV